MEILFALILFAISTMITPGPNNIMIMASGLNFGIKRSLPHFLGICLGFPVMVLAVGLGFGVLFVEFPIIHSIIKIVGAIYLLYLAWHIARAHTKLNSKTPSRPLHFWQAVLFQWVNPKAWVMAIGAVAAYTVGIENMPQQIIMICTVFLITAFPCIGIWLYCGAQLKRLLKSEQHQKYFNYTMAALLVISVALIFLE